MSVIHGIYSSRRIGSVVYQGVMDGMMDNGWMFVFDVSIPYSVHYVVPWKKGVDNYVHCTSRTLYI